MIGAPFGVIPDAATLVNVHPALGDEPNAHQHHGLDEVWQGRLIWRVCLVSATWRTAGNGRHEAPLLLQSSTEKVFNEFFFYIVEQEGLLLQALHRSIKSLRTSTQPCMSTLLFSAGSLLYMHPL